MNILKRLVSPVAEPLFRLPLYTHTLLAALAFLATRLANAVLDKSYAASNYPVPFYEGQLAFRASTLKAYYQIMLEAGTLGIYWSTQMIDFAFIAAMVLAGLIVSLWLARINRRSQVLYGLALLAALLIPLGATFDALENLISFLMLRRPLSFPAGLAPLYSSFAALKFTAIGAGYSLWLICLLGFLVTSVRGRLRR